MRKLYAALAGVVFGLALNLHAAQLTATPVALSAEDISTMVEAVAQTTPTPASQVPDNGRYYSARTPDGPPMPGNMNFPAWNLGDNVWLLDDLKPTASTSRSMTAMDISLPTDGGDDGDDTNGGSYTPNANLSGYVPPNTNGLWLELTNYDGNWAYLNLHNGTNQVYAIWSTTNLPGGWQVETELWPVGLETNVFPFTVTALNRQNLFLRAEDWTGVDSNGDGIPDWWIWLYFGNLTETATNLDANGNTLLYDYTNNLAPVLFQFYGISVTNNYVNTLTPLVQLSVTGSPYYIATLVDDTNFNDAVWNDYTSSNVTVNLGFTQGWHDVWIGLHGHGDSPANAVWQWQRLNLDYTPPALFITSPTNGTVSIPVLQLAGYSPETLSSINYDLTNATGLVTNQQVLITDQYYDTNLWAFTTNYFQGFDIPLTNGVNTFTLHATDLAGNATTVVTNIFYQPATNLPVVQISWPSAGTMICGSNFTCNGSVSDPTVAVSVQMVNTNGVTNIFNGIVGRTGNFSVPNLPLSGGTNALTLNVTSAAGTSSTNFNVAQGSLGLTINTVTAGQATITGNISSSAYTIWVNGVKGTNNGNGTWTAQISPIGVGGGVVEAMAIPNTDNGGNGSGGYDVAGNPLSAQGQGVQAWVTAPSGVYISSYQEQDEEAFSLDPAHPYEPDYPIYPDGNRLNWQDGQDGSLATRFWDDGTPALVSVTWPATRWPQALPVATVSETLYSPTNVSQVLNVDNHYGTTAPNLVEEHCDYSYINPAFISQCTLYKRTADAECKLATGGPPGSKQQNLWVISATATVYTNIADATGTPVPPQQIQIGSLGNLDTNGNLFVVLPDNDPDNVTPKVNGDDNYTFTVAATEYTLRIAANTQWLSDGLTPNPQFCVGQQITFSPSWTPSAPPYVDAAVQWTLPGTFVNTNSDPNCDLFYSEDASQLNRSATSPSGSLSTSCWYVDKLQSGNATLAMNLTLTNGQHISLNASGTFDVYRPTTQFIFPDGDGTPTMITTNNNTLSLGIPSYQDMSFGHNIASPNFSGHAGYTQVINGEVSIASTGGTSPDLSPSVNSLDNAEFYEGTPAVDTTNTTVFRDSPAVGLRTVLIDNQNPKFINVNYNTYLLFKPDAGPGPNIYVPLQLVTWQVDATATYGTPWTVTASFSGTPPVTAPTSVDCTTFPDWQNVFNNWGF